jgi:hypothetical protein
VRSKRWSKSYRSGTHSLTSRSSKRWGFRALSWRLTASLLPGSQTVIGKYMASSR